jgi:putative hemolysin
MFLFVLAFLSFFFSASETAIIGLSKIRLRHMIAQGMRRAQSIQRLVTKLDKVIAAILIGNNFVNIAISAIVTAIFVRIFGYNWGIIIATFVTSMCVLIFCEITPKILATKHTERIALFIAPIMESFIKILSPIIIFFIGISNFILKMLRIEPPKRSPLITEEELRTMIEIGKEEGVLTDEERRLLHRIFEFGDTKVKDVMVPNDKIVAIDIKSPPEKLIDMFVEEGHARIPVFDGSQDNITGIIYGRDLLYILNNKQLFVLEDLVHKPFYVDMEKRVNECLREFQQDKIQIAIVVDKKKKTIGLVTLEDLIEEIVGEIEEHIPHSHNFRNSSSDAHN